jgi:hypothetical protein
VVAVIWPLDVALVILGAGIGSRDVAAAVGGLGLERGGCGGCRRVVCRPGSVLRGSGGPGGCSEARGGAVVVVVNDVDGGCVVVVSDDVATARVGLGGLTEVWVAGSLVLGAVWVLESANDVVIGFFRSGGSVCRAAQRWSWAALVCTAVSMVIVVVWVLPSVVSVLVCFPFSCLRSSAIPPLYASSNLSSTSSPHCLYASL